MCIQRKIRILHEANEWDDSLNLKDDEGARSSGKNKEERLLLKLNFNFEYFFVCVNNAQLFIQNFKLFLTLLVFFFKEHKLR